MYFKLKIMIYFNDKKWGKSLEALLTKNGFNRLDNSERTKIDNILNKGGDVFFKVNPFVSEMNGGEEGAMNEFIWDINKEDLSDTFYQLMEEI